VKDAGRGNTTSRSGDPLVKVPARAAFPSSPLSTETPGITLPFRSPYGVNDDGKDKVRVRGYFATIGDEKVLWNGIKVGQQVTLLAGIAEDQFDALVLALDGHEVIKKP